MRPANHRTRIERLVEVVLNGPSGVSDDDVVEWARKAEQFDGRDLRVVVLGGGTGLSTVVGGNSAVPGWAKQPFVGLKQDFLALDVVVCTTDDGGSTGELLKHLPMIGIGDLRKSCMSLIREENLRATYSVDGSAMLLLIELIQQVFNYRFPEHSADSSILRDPVRAAHPDLVAVAPDSLRTWLASLGRAMLPGGEGPALDPAGNSLGNLILTAAIFRAAGSSAERAPNLSEIRAGLDEVATHIGGASGRLHAVTSTPGQLRFRYANGVEVYGQKKAGLARRGFPVQRVDAEFVSPPEVSDEFCRTLREADLVIFAPGSVYSSMIPVLQLPPVVEAIRSNRRARKLLAANFWIQRGETDISAHHQERGFLVSELIEAYHQNVPGGIQGLFEIVLCANLEHIPGHILRNYSLEGKRAIHLDRARVEGMGLLTLETTLFSRDNLEQPGVIHHDAGNFARAVRTLCYADRHPEALQGRELPREVDIRPNARRADASVGARVRGRPLCEYYASIQTALAPKHFEPESLREVMLDLCWENRDIQPDHLGCFDGVRVVPAYDWGRSTEWDNVLGFYDAEGRRLKVHEQLLKQPERLRESLLIALGESLLGRYIEIRRWDSEPAVQCHVGRCYEIRLRPPEQRRCYLSDEQLRRFLSLARMIQDAEDPLVYRLTLNGDEGFIPSGLLFGLLFAWYLNSDYGGAMAYEMSLLGWPPQTLMPHHVKERARKEALVTFFCEEVFGHRSLGS